MKHNAYCSWCGTELTIGVAIFRSYSMHSGRDDIRLFCCDYHAEQFEKSIVGISLRVNSNIFEILKNISGVVKLINKRFGRKV